ncbi:hypothetical protein ANN_24383 [Periplaneta americana]|uniref:Uncharacterized protein n=1 Tax=Periplaneta americana TaxID=6978 RepID=A0ABQ8S2X4_PERAM|nr:hypothetical protein ANN_24383 [Periplaneta americana]
MAGLCDGGNEPPGSLKASKMYQLVPSATGWMDSTTPLPHDYNTDEKVQRLRSVNNIDATTVCTHYTAFSPQKLVLHRLRHNQDKIFPYETVRCDEVDADGL